MSRRPSATTLARKAAAMAHREEAIAALHAGRTLVLSIRTNIEAGTIHHGLARRLVMLGDAEYLPDPDREGWKLTTHIRRRSTA